jgi:hypothetical protein
MEAFDVQDVELMELTALISNLAVAGKGRGGGLERTVLPPHQVRHYSLL